ncbi:MAG: SpoVG family protein [Lachnospiraceae bacterium]
MRVTAKIVAREIAAGRLKGIATVCLNQSFLITGVRIVDCENGLTVFMPSRRASQEEYRDICFPITKELHRQIRDVVLTAYEEQEIKAETAQELP